MSKIFAIIFLIFAFTLQAEEDDFCGKTTKVPSYEISYGEANLYLPKHLEIISNGKSLYADEKTSEWVYPYNGILTATTDNFLLLEVYRQDCVDLIHRRLFIFNPKGELLVNEVIWTGHWEDAFLIENEKIIYWSKWFCHENNQETSINQSYVYSWDGKGTFEKEPRSKGDYCSEAAISRIKNEKLTFKSYIPKGQ